MSVPTMREMESPSAVVCLCLSHLGRQRGDAAAWGALQPLLLALLTPQPSSQRGSRGIPLAEQQRHPLGRAAEHHSRQLCRVLHTQDWWCNTSHCTGTNCFVSALRIGAQAQSHLFYISLLMNANTGL